MSLFGGSRENLPKTEHGGERRDSLANASGPLQGSGILNNMPNERYNDESASRVNISPRDDIQQKKSSTRKSV